MLEYGNDHRDCRWSDPAAGFDRGGYSNGSAATPGGAPSKSVALPQQAQHRERTAEDARAAADEEAARAQRVRAEADEKEAEARRHEIAAQERTGEAEGKTVVAREHHDRAREVDPDVSDSGEDEALDLNDGTDSASRPM